MQGWRSVLVTGASRGIGRSIAVEAARRGARTVVVNYRRDRQGAEETARLVREAGAEPIIVKADVSNYSEVEKLVATAEDAGPVDLAVANAGVLRPGLFIESSRSSWMEEVAVNLVGVLNLGHVLLPRMASRRRGVFAIVSSVLGINPEPEASVYSATKAGVIAWARAVAKELAEYGVRVFTVAPGGVDTSMARAWGVPVEEWISEVPLRRLASPWEVARILLDAAENPYITGDIITISGGLL